MTIEVPYALATSLALILLLVLRFRQERLSLVGLVGLLIAAIGLTAHGFLRLVGIEGELSDTAWTLRVISTANTSAIMCLLLSFLLHRRWQHRGGSQQGQEDSELSSRSV